MSANKCRGCDRAVAKTAHALQCVLCIGWYHIKCGKLEEGDYDFMSRRSKLGFRWCCGSCIEEGVEDNEEIRKENNLLKRELERITKVNSDLEIKIVNMEEEKKSKSDEGNTVLDAINSKIDMLLSAGNLAATGNSTVVSYANVVKRENVLILKPTSSEVGPKENKEELTTALKKVTVKGSRITKGGSIVLDFPNPESLDGARAALEKGTCADRFTTRLPKRMEPKITLCNLPQEIEDDMIIDLVLEKNKFLCDKVNDGGKFELLFAKPGARDTKNFIFKCSPAVRKEIIDRGGYLYVDLERYKVYDRYHIIQCYHCQAFGHIAKNCEEAKKGNLQTCGKCSGHHKTLECVSTFEKCVNCSRLGKESTNHACRSESCVVFVAERKRVINNTDHGI